VPTELIYSNHQEIEMMIIKAFSAHRQKKKYTSNDQSRRSMIDAMNFLRSRSIGEEIAIFCGWGSPAPLDTYVSTIRKSSDKPDSGRTRNRCEGEDRSTHRSRHDAISQTLRRTITITLAYIRGGVPSMVQVASTITVGSRQGRRGGGGMRQSPGRREEGICFGIRLYAVAYERIARECLGLQAARADRRLCVL